MSIEKPEQFLTSQETPEEKIEREKEDKAEIKKAYKGIGDMKVRNMDAVFGRELAIEILAKLRKALEDNDVENVEK